MGMKWTRALVAWLVLITGLLIGGCASAPIASVERDQAAKTFATKPGKGLVYVYRNEGWGGAVAMDILLDGAPVGKTGAMTYFVIETLPGRHSLTSKAENESSLDLVLEEGKNYFVWQEVKMGLLMARSKLQLVDETTGRAGVIECQLLDASAR